MHACMHGACIRQCTCRLSVKNLIGYACACGERVCACACACLSVWGLDEQIFASPARAFWRQQLQEFLDKGCKYEIEALNAVHHVGSDPLGYFLFSRILTFYQPVENERWSVLTTLIQTSALTCIPSLVAPGPALRWPC